MLVLMGLLLPVLFAFTAVVVDIGYLYVTRRMLQNAVDAAALAGAQFLPEDPETARATANTYLANNIWATSPGSLPGSVDSITITVGRKFVPNDIITVTANRQVSFVVGPLVGFAGFNAAATATAIVGSPVRADCPLPLGLIDQNGSAPGMGYAFGEQVTLKLKVGDDVNSEQKCLIPPTNFIPLDINPGNFNTSDYHSELGGHCEEGEWLQAGQTVTNACEAANVVQNTYNGLMKYLGGRGRNLEDDGHIFSEVVQQVGDPPQTVIVNHGEGNLGCYRLAIMPVLVSHTNETIEGFAMVFIEKVNKTTLGGDYISVVVRFINPVTSSGSFGSYSHLGPKVIRLIV